MATNSNRALLDELFKKAKKNTGSGVLTGYDLSTYSPQKVSDRRITEGGSYIEPRQLNQTQNYEEYAPIPQVEYPEYPELITNEQGQGDAQQFLEAFNKSVTPQKPASQQEQEQFYQETYIPYGIKQLNDGGVLYADNIVRYSDGTIREYKGDNAYGVASLLDGTGEQYSDGTVRRKANPEAFITQDNLSYLNGGLQGLISGIFGQDATTTQAYGNYNPSLGYRSGYHSGTDIVASGDYKLPVDAQVVQIYQDDGTQWGDQSGHQGYGNSVLVRLSSGEMLRFSHLADAPQFQVGDLIGAGQVFGRMGSTGNSTGEHTDLEYYDVNGNIANPTQFSGFAPDSQFKQEYVSKLPELVKGVSNQSNMQKPEQFQTSQLPKPVETPQIPQSEQFSSNIIKPEYQDTQLSQNRSLGATLRQVPKQIGQIAGGVSTAIEQTQPTGTGFDLGISEALRGDLQGSSAVRQATMGNIERKAQEGGQVLGAAIERQQPTGQGFDLGISEMLRGDTEGSQAVRGATMDNIARKIQENYGTATTAIADFIGNLKQQSAPQAGEGVSFAKSAYAKEPTSSLMNVNEEYSSKIGDSPTSSLQNPTISIADTARGKYQQEASQPKDIRDDFFKSGESQKYSSYLTDNPDQKYGGALNPNVFKSSFYERRDAQPDIQKVLGATSMYDEGNKRFTDYRTNENQKLLDEWRAKYQGKSRYDQNELNSLYNQYKDQTSGTSFFDMDSLKKPTYHEPSLEDYLRRGKSIAEWYAETGRQGDLDKQGGPEKAMKNYQESKKSSKNSQSSKASSSSGFSQGSGYSGGGMSGGGGGSWGSVTNPQSSNYSSSSGFSQGNSYSGGGGGGGGGGSWSSNNDQSIFQKAASTISNLFKRIF